MTDDPWKKPDPNAPPPGYGPPPPGYGPPPGYPGYNPYQPGPLPKRGGIKRLLIILGVAGLLLLGGCGVGIYFLVDYVGKNADEVNAFLANVRNQQFDEAYARLCPNVRVTQAQTEFTSGLETAVARDHRVVSYDILAVKTTSTNGVTLRSAGGTVNFSDGRTLNITFDLEKTGSRLCISSGYQLLKAP